MWRTTQTAIAMVFASVALAAPASADEDAAVLYQIYCTQCHGINADGKGINASHMSVQPRDHTDATEMGTRTDDDLFKVIKHGGKSINKSVLMPAWGHNLNDDQVHALVHHLRTLCCGE